MASNAPPTATIAPAMRGPSRQPTKRRWWMRVLFGLLITAGVTAVSVAGVYIFGRVHGVELCAETLERRSFDFLEIPLIGIQVKGTQHRDVSGALEKHLAAKKLVKQPSAAKKTWHVIEVVRGVSGHRRGDAEILCRYLDARDSNGEVAWLEWTKGHPKLAPHIWGGVCDLALAGKYTLIPDLLELTQRPTDPAETQVEINQIVARAKDK